MMITLIGYTITEKIYTGIKSLVYRGIRQSDNRSVVIKFLNTEYPTFKELVLFRNQFTITNNLNYPSIIKPYSLETYGNGLALVMEDFGGISLADYTAGEPLTIDEFFPIAISISEVLEILYQHRIIHKDIKPANLLINPDTKQIKITDFSISSLLPKEHQEIKNINVLEGTLAYMSPEQTGRMNRTIDYRTDFYSLGVTFYQLLTGKLPYESSDMMELIHCHIAKKPIPPIEVNPAIPQMINDIIIKLMAKTAEFRYQSAYGIKYDLENCYKQWQKIQEIKLFELGKRDISASFVIPEKIYGRDIEIATLLSAFERASKGTPEIMLVAGFSGIGKTAIVNEIHKPIVRQNGYFIKGKFDQFQRSIPFSALVEAFRDLMGQLLAENEAKIQQWQDKIIAALGENANIIIEVIPELEKIIGKQPPVPKLAGTSAENRFNRVFQKFVQVFTTEDHPLVIFMDDLQWADTASLKLMQLLMIENNNCYLLLIGAYRNNEVLKAHPLLLTLAEIRQTGIKVNTINLMPLSKSHLNHLIADTLSCPLDLALPLTKLVYQKTKGNPFFINQFLKYLYEDNLINFNFQAGYWQCDLATIQSKSLTNDVIDFLARQLQKMPKNTQNALKLAACIGHKFDLETLAIVQEISLGETAKELWPALQEGLILPITEVYKFFQETSSIDIIADDNLIIPYRFLHDRVQQAAYSLIPETQKKATHLKIGQLLLNKISGEAREDKIFEIVNQLNYGIDLISDRSQRQELAELNLLAGCKAKASTAYGAAMGYLTLGIQLLEKNSWETQYNLTLSLYQEAAEAAYLNGYFGQMEELANLVLQKAKTLFDTIRIYEIKIQTYTARSQQIEAVNIGLELIELLGFKLNKSPTETNIQQGKAEIQQDLHGKNIEYLINLPVMTDANQLAILRILSSITAASFIAVPNLFPLIVFAQVKLSIKYGNDALSAFAYSVYGLMLNGVFTEIETGYKFGELAIKLIEIFHAQEFKAKTFNVVGAHIMHGKVHLRDTLSILQEAYQSGLENGDLEYVGYAAKHKCNYSYFCGEELEKIEEEMTNYSHVLKQVKQESALTWINIFHQVVLNLMGKNENPCNLIGDAYNEQKILPVQIEGNDRTGLHYFYLHKLILCYLFGEYNQAIKNAQLASQYLDGVTGIVVVSIFYFYESLTLLALYEDSPSTEKTAILEKIQANQEKLQIRTLHAPMNFQHKYDLIEAEKARVLGDKILASEYYDRAIAAAKENQYIQEQALANELAAKFYLIWGKEKIAGNYIINSYYNYAHWQAKAKLEYLEKNYLQLLAPILKPEKYLLNFSETLPIYANTSVVNDNNMKTIISSSKTISETLDLKTVIKAFQTLSSEINLDKLVATLLQLVIENAGADAGALILKSGENLLIEARGKSRLKITVDVHPIPVDKSGDKIPVTIVNYVARTGDQLVINNVKIEKIFAADPYIIEHEPKSILCLPLHYQSKLIGIIYLENNLTVDAFTTERLEIINLLCSQAAISLENAKLYQNMQKTNQALEEAKVAAESASRSKSTFLANMSHELRTPLNAIIGYSEMLAEEAEDLGVEDIIPDLDKIRTAGNHLLSIISDILDISKIESGLMKLDLNDLYINSLISEIETTIQPLIAKNNNQFAVISSPNIGIIHSDVVKVRQILLNLLSNAAKFTENGKITLEVKRINTSKNSNKDWICFSVSDTGIGMTPEQTNKIFEAFVQADASMTRKYGGTGLGLAISQRFCQMMGGNIIVASQLNVGSTFTIYLPAVVESI